MPNDLLIHLAVWLLVGSSVGLSAEAPPSGLNSRRGWIAYMAPGFHHSKCPKRTKKTLHCLKSYVNHFSDSPDYKWVSNISTDSGGEVIEPTWEGCQRLCGQILKLLHFIIAVIIQMGPKMYLTKSNWPMLLKRQSGSIPISASNTGFPWVLKGCCINMHWHLIKSKVGLCMDLFWTVSHDYMP